MPGGIVSGISDGIDGAIPHDPSLNVPARILPSVASVSTFSATLVDGDGGILIPVSLTGINRVLYVWASTEAGGTGAFFTVEYNGTPLTLFQNAGRVPGWYIVAPDDGMHDLLFAYNSGGSDSQRVRGGVIGLINASQETIPHREPVALGSAGGSPTEFTFVPMTTETGDVMIDNLFLAVDVTGDSPGFGQIERWNLDTPPPEAGDGSTKTSSGVTDTMSWTVGAGSAWDYAGISVKPA